MHLRFAEAGFLGSNPIVGGGIPLAAGAAFAEKLRHTGDIVVCFFGDGASNEGTFHESLNLASIWKLPVLFVCINNQYGMSMHVRRSMNIEDISVRAASYGMPGRSVDGNDAEVVYTATRDARTTVRANGPLLLVLNTYRIMGHSKSDAGLYRSKEEVESWKRRDPLQRLACVLRENGVSAEQIAEMDAAAAHTVEEAVAFAEASPEPSVDTVEEDVYA